MLFFIENGHENSKSIVLGVLLEPHSHVSIFLQLWVSREEVKTLWRRSCKLNFVLLAYYDKICLWILSHLNMNFKNIASKISVTNLVKEPCHTYKKGFYSSDFYNFWVSHRQTVETHLCFNMSTTLGMVVK